MTGCTEAAKRNEGIQEGTARQREGRHQREDRVHFSFLSGLSTPTVLAT